MITRKSDVIIGFKKLNFGAVVFNIEMQWIPSGPCSFNKPFHSATPLKNQATGWGSAGSDLGTRHQYNLPHCVGRREVGWVSFLQKQCRTHVTYHL